MKYPMCVIIEGPNGAGKTTLAKYLCQGLLNGQIFAYRHEGPPPWPSPRSLFGYYIDPILRLENPTVFDRWGHGEWVYGPLLRDGARMTKRQLEAYLEVVRYYAVHVLCLPPVNTVIDNFNDDPKVPGKISLENNIRAWAAYREDRYEFECTYDYVNQQPKDIAHFINEQWRQKHV